MLTCSLATTSLVQTYSRLIKPNRPKPVTWWFDEMIRTFFRSSKRCKIEVSSSSESTCERHWLIVTCLSFIVGGLTFCVFMVPFWIDCIHVQLSGSQLSASEVNILIFTKTFPFSCNVNLIWLQSEHSTGFFLSFSRFLSKYHVDLNYTKEAMHNTPFFHFFFWMCITFQFYLFSHHSVRILLARKSRFSYSLLLFIPSCVYMTKEFLSYEYLTFLKFNEICCNMKL